jgi:hypothetical protein
MNRIGIAARKRIRNVSPVEKLSRKPKSTDPKPAAIPATKSIAPDGITMSNRIRTTATRKRSVAMVIGAKLRISRKSGRIGNADAKLFRSIQRQVPNSPDIAAREHSYRL